MSYYSTWQVYNPNTDDTPVILKREWVDDIDIEFESAKGLAEWLGFDVSRLVGAAIGTNYTHRKWGLYAKEIKQWLLFEAKIEDYTAEAE